MANKTTPILHKNIRGAEYYAQSIEEPKTTTPLSRLREFIGWAMKQGMCSTLFDFEKQCGLSHRYISNSTANGKGNVGAELLGRIVRQYPMLNLVWVCNGDGEMLNDVDASINADYKKAYEGAMMQVEVLRRIIETKGL